MSSDLATLKALVSCLEGVPAPALDWQRVIALANRTLITPLLSSAIAANPGVPGEVAQFLDTIAARTRARNALMLEQLAELVSAINGVDVEPILLKGSAFLAQRVTPCADRLFSDLDLMIPAAAAEEVAGILAELGYRQEDAHVDLSQGANFYRERDAGGVDLHCRLKAPYPTYVYEDLLSGGRRTALGSGYGIIPSPAWQAAILILHDQLQERDYWRGAIDVRHLLDLRAIATGGEGINWTELAELFPIGHARHALNTQLLTLATLFGVTIPCAARGDMVARLQLRRRKLQLHLRWLAPVFTALSLLIDPPFRRREVSGADGVEHKASARHRIFKIMNRQFLRPVAGKL